jgi:hypothetical protein
LLGARIEGIDLHFSFMNAEGQLQAAKLQVQGQGQVQGQTLAGELIGPYGMVEVQPEVVKVLGQRIGH